MTKREYINQHPKSFLAARMEKTAWSDEQQVEIIGGLIAPDNKCSNLYRALQRAAIGEYLIGGHRQRGTEGWWIAVV